MGLKFIFGIFIFIASSARAQVPLVESCFTPDQIRSEIADFQKRNAIALQTPAVPVEFVYSELEFDIGGYGVFSNPEKVEITIYGKKCKNGLLKKDELQLLLCHEIGHALAGEPYINFTYSVIKVSTEGQADYYTTSKCLPALWGDEDNRPFLKELENYPKLAEICTSPDDNKRGLCVRMGIASLNFSRYVFDPMSSGHHLSTRSPGPYPELDGHDPLIVKKTYLAEYPTAQCRLETYLAGMSKGARPSCWFRAEPAAH